MMNIFLSQWVIRKWYIMAENCHGGCEIFAAALIYDQVTVISTRGFSACLQYCRLSPGHLFSLARWWPRNWSVAWWKGRKILVNELHRMHTKIPSLGMIWEIRRLVDITTGGLTSLELRLRYFCAIICLLLANFSCFSAAKNSRVARVQLL